MSRAAATGTGRLATLVFAAALALHVAAWLQYRSDPFSATLVSDALSYHQWALRLAEHGLAAEPVFHQSPLFPLILGAVWAMAPGNAAPACAMALQALLDCLAFALLVPLGRAYLGSRTVGVAAAAVALLHGPFVFHGLKLLPVPLALATQATALVLLAEARRSDRAWLGAACGVAWGIAFVARAETILFLPIALLALVRGGETPGSRARWRTAAACLAGMALAVAPVTAHNVRRGDAVLIASAGGENLFIGNQRDADGGHTPLDPRAGDIFSQRILATKIAEEARGEPLSASRVSAYWRGRAFAEIAADPGRWFVLELRKLGRILHPGDPTDIYSFPLERDRYLGVLRIAVLPAGALWLLALAGALVVPRSRIRAAWPLAAFVALHVAVLLAFFVSTRLRLPLLFFLCPFAGHALVEGWRRWRERRSRAVWATLAAAVALSATWWMFVATPTPRERIRLSSVLSMQGRLDEALEVLDSLTAGPAPDALALDQSGWVEQKRGNDARAESFYRRALEIGLPEGRSAQTRTRLARVYAETGRPDDARREYDAAVREAPDRGGPRYERALFRLSQGDRVGAVEDLRESRRLEPDWPAPAERLRSLGEPAD